MSLPTSYFESMYAASPDPWGFETRWYERRKRAMTMACLPDEWIGRVFEPGCATGLLTEALAARSAHVLAADVVERALETARQRLDGHPNVRLARMEVPHEWPTGEVFDLIVLSEIGYYQPPAGARLLAENTAHSLTPGGVVLACHWRHPVAEHPTSASHVHTTLAAHLDTSPLAHHCEDDFVLDVWRRAPSPSVAEGTGLLS